MSTRCEPPAIVLMEVMIASFLLSFRTPFYILTPFSLILIKLTHLSLIVIILMTTAQSTQYTGATRITNGAQQLMLAHGAPTDSFTRTFI